VYDYRTIVGSAPRSREFDSSRFVPIPSFLQGVNASPTDPHFLVLRVLCTFMWKNNCFPFLHGEYLRAALCQRHVSQEEDIDLFIAESVVSSVAGYHDDHLSICFKDMEENSGLRCEEVNSSLSVPPWLQDEPNPLPRRVWGVWAPDGSMILVDIKPMIITKDSFSMDMVRFHLKPRNEIEDVFVPRDRLELEDVLDDIEEKVLRPPPEMFTVDHHSTFEERKAFFVLLIHSITHLTKGWRFVEDGCFNGLIKNPSAVIKQEDSVSCSVCFEDFICETSSRDTVDDGMESTSKGIVPCLRLHCGHVFHVHCLGRYFTYQGRYTCPVCREPFVLDDSS
jgi:hypothetical protein